jgi:sulfide:quinone oxidoreductase
LTIDIFSWPAISCLIRIRPEICRIVAMHKVTHITPAFAVTGALQPADVAEIAAAGFKSVLSNLPDGEQAAYLTSRQEAELAARAGLAFRHVPTNKAELFTDRVVDGVSNALRELPGPVLAHCASGMRSAVAWGTAASRLQPVDAVLATLKAAGFNLDAVRDELECQRDPGHSGPIPPALDVHR